MTAEIFAASIGGFAALCGALVGRIFAIEAPDRRTAVFAAAYCGAGGGLVSAVPGAFVLVLTVKWWAAGVSIAGLTDAVEGLPHALAWGLAGGAGGGLLVGIVVALFKRSTPLSRSTPI